MADYTFEQYMNAAQKADAAGDEDGARQLVQAARGLQQTSSDAAAGINRRTDLPQIGPDPLFSGLGRGFKGLLELPELAGRAAYHGDLMPTLNQGSRHLVGSSTRGSGRCREVLMKV